MKPEDIGYSIDNPNFQKEELAPLLAHKTLENLSVSVPLSMEQWGWIDELLGSHANTLNLGLIAWDKKLLANQPTWDALDFLPSLKHLRELTIFDPNIRDIATVFQCIELQSFVFMDSRKNGSLDVKGISKLRKLKTLLLGWPVVHFEEINTLEGLENLLVSNQKKGFDISRLRNLTELSLSAVATQASDAFLLDFPKLRSLHVWGDFLHQFTAIQELKAFKSLSISKNKKLNSLDFVEGIPQLESLELYQVSNVTRLPDLSQLRDLKTLKIMQMKRLSDLSNILQMKSLEELEIVEVPEKPFTFWLEILDHLPNLKEFRVEHGNWEEMIAIAKEIRSRGIGTYEIGMD
jgi:hypothetical protein